MRYINISNEKQRDAEVVYKTIKSPPGIKMALKSGASVVNRRFYKGTSKTSINNLLKKFKDPTKLAEQLINSDPDVDLELEGKTLNSSDRVYINQDEEVVYKVKKNEKVYLFDGTFKEEREPKYLEANISIDNPIKWTGKLIPRTKLFNKVIFNKNYQICHVNGLTYDFLFEMASNLSEKKSMMMLGAGKNGNAPLVFNDGGNPYRAFLEGRIKGDKYCLILHLTDLELKPLPKKET